MCPKSPVGSSLTACAGSRVRDLSRGRAILAVAAFPRFKGRIGGVPVDSFGRNRRRLGAAALLPLCALLMWGCNSAAGSAAPVADVSPFRSHAVGTAQSSSRSDAHANSAPVTEQSVFLSAGAARSAGSRAADPGEDRGEVLTIWSYHGENWITCLGRGTAADIAAFEAELAAQGLSLNDISVATGGRSDIADPPYFIRTCWPGIRKRLAADHCARSSRCRRFRETVIEGKTVSSAIQRRSNRASINAAGPISGTARPSITSSSPTTKRGRRRPSFAQLTMTNAVARRADGGRSSRPARPRRSGDRLGVLAPSGMRSAAMYDHRRMPVVGRRADGPAVGRRSRTSRAGMFAFRGVGHIRRDTITAGCLGRAAIVRGP